MEDINPIIVDLGKKKRKAIKDLKRGRGRALDQIEQAVQEVRASLGAEGEGKTLVPVVVVYRRKQKKSRRRAGLLGL